MPCSWTGNLALWRWWSFFTHAFGHLMQRADSFEKTLMLGKIEGKRRGDDRGWDGWMASSTQRTWVWVDSGSWWWTGRPGVLWLMGSQRVGHDWVTELNWRWLPVDIVTDGYPFLKEYFYWRFIDLQSCVSGAQQSDSVTYIFNLFQILSLQVIIEYWVELPMLYRRSFSAIYFIYCWFVYVHPNF